MDIENSDVVIIDYQAGNTLSVKNMVSKIGYKASISSEPDDIKNAKKIILPGVGHFDYGIQQLKALGLWEILNEKALEEKVPFLGICLGAQLITKGSEEGKEAGLSWFNIKTRKFVAPRNEVKIPHMGWNDVFVKSKNNILFDETENKNEEENPRFYFVHSYHFDGVSADEILTTTFYGYEFVSSFFRDNIYAVQFHPEKSHKFGMKLLKNFLSI